MENNSLIESPKKKYTVFPQKQNYGFDYACQSMNNAKKGDTIIAHLFRLTNPKIVSTLCAKAQESDVQIIVDNDKDTVEQAKKIVQAGGKAWVYKGETDNSTSPSTKYKKNLHKKAIGWSITTLALSDINQQEEKIYRVFDGSANPTNKAAENLELSFLNQEREAFETLEKDHHELIKTATPLHDTTATIPLSPVKKTTQLIAESPKKNSSRIASSFNYSLAKTFLKRLEKNDTTSCVLMYNFDQATAHDELKKASKEGKLKEIVVNYTAFKETNNNLLLQELATNGTNVYVYNHDERKKAFLNPRLNADMHAKVLIRSDDLVAVSSANLTTKNNNDINSLSLINNNDFAEQARDQFDAIKKESTPLEEIVTSLQKNKKQKTIPSERVASSTLSQNLENSSANSSQSTITFNNQQSHPSVEIVSSQLLELIKDITSKKTLQPTRYQNVLKNHAQTIYALSQKNDDVVNLHTLFKQAVALMVDEKGIATLTFKNDCLQLLNGATTTEKKKSTKKNSSVITSLKSKLQKQKKK